MLGLGKRYTPIRILGTANCDPKGLNLTQIVIAMHDCIAQKIEVDDG